MFYVVCVCVMVTRPCRPEPRSLLVISVLIMVCMSRASEQEAEQEADAHSVGEEMVTREEKDGYQLRSNNANETDVGQA